MEPKWSLAGRMEKCVLNGNEQDEAEPKPTCSLASSLFAGRILSFFQHFK
jgi:hypothetical protein